MARCPGGELLAAAVILAGIAAPPPLRACADVVVRLDGRRTTGPVTLGNIRYSEGTVRQRGVDIDLTEVAYIRFADRASCGRTSGTRRPVSRRGVPVPSLPRRGGGGAS